MKKRWYGNQQTETRKKNVMIFISLTCYNIAFSPAKIVTITTNIRTTCVYMGKKSERFTLFISSFLFLWQIDFSFIALRFIQPWLPLVLLALLSFCMKSHAICPSFDVRMIKHVLNFNSTHSFYIWFEWCYAITLIMGKIKTHTEKIFSIGKIW